MGLRAGVVGVQGDVIEHARAIERLSDNLGRVTVEPVRRRGVIPSCDFVTLPGGESTTIGRLVHEQGIDEELRAHVDAGKPLLATCAGMIVAATDPGDVRVEPLGLIDVEVDRNAFGRQRDSFEASVSVSGFDTPFPGVFIRAPVVRDPRDTEVLASIDGRVVAVRDGPVVATAFHPELTADSRIHELALSSGR